MSSNLATIDMDQISKMESVVTECGLAKLSGVGSFERTFKLAAGVRRLRDLITPDMMKDIVQLQDTPLGFRTDSDPKLKKFNSNTGQWEWNKPYDAIVVKECLIEAMLRGAFPVGNEFNIIAGRTYLTKEFFSRATGQLPGVSELRVSPGVPRMAGEGAVVRVNVTWKANGKPDGLVDEKGTPGRDFAIRVNKQMGSDAIIGKATRKALKAAYEQITGSHMPDGDADDSSNFIDGELVGQPTNGQAAKVSEQVKAAAAEAVNAAPRAPVTIPEPPAPPAPVEPPPEPKEKKTPVGTAPVAAQPAGASEPVEVQSSPPANDAPPAAEASEVINSQAEGEPSEPGKDPLQIGDEHSKTYPGFASKFYELGEYKKIEFNVVDASHKKLVLNRDVKSPRLQTQNLRRQVLEAIIWDKYNWQTATWEVAAPANA